jgi:hypothetical protein
MDLFDKDTRTCSHNTKHGQTGGTMWNACESVCAKGQQCKRYPGSCEFGTSTKVETPKGKCDMQNNCCFKVIISEERKNHVKQSDGDQFSVSENSSIFDHSLTCSALGASSKQLTKSMVYNSDVAKSMLTFCKNANAPEIIQAVEGEQRAAAGQAHTTRRWLHDMGQPKSIIDAAIPAEHDYKPVFAATNPPHRSRGYSCIHSGCLLYQARTQQPQGLGTLHIVRTQTRVQRDIIKETSLR